MSPDFDPTRFRELVAYIAWKTRDDSRFGRVKLAKTLFYADFGAYAEEGAPLTGARYEHWPFGPFPPDLYEAERELVRTGVADSITEGGDGDEAKLVVTREPTTPHLDNWQRSFIDQKIGELAPLTATQISDESHEHPGWSLTQDSEVIPYAAALVPQAPSAKARAIAAERFSRSA